MVENGQKHSKKQTRSLDPKLRLGMRDWERLEISNNKYQKKKKRVRQFCMPEYEELHKKMGHLGVEF